MELIFTKAADKRLADMPRTHARKMLALLRDISEAPTISHAQVKKLVGAENLYRLRVSNWRAVYELIWQNDTMVVLVIDVRGNIYE